MSDMSSTRTSEVGSSISHSGSNISTQISANPVSETKKSSHVTWQDDLGSQKPNESHLSNIVNSIEQGNGSPDYDLGLMQDLSILEFHVPKRHNSHRASLGGKKKSTTIRARGATLA